AKPSRVSSSRMGWTSVGSYIGTCRLLICTWVVEAPGIYPALGFERAVRVVPDVNQGGKPAPNPLPERDELLRRRLGAAEPCLGKPRNIGPGGGYRPGRDPPPL